MMAPTMAMEPPTSQDEAFHFVDISHASRAISRSQAAASFESPFKASSLSLQNDAGIFHSSPPEMFSSSPNSSPGAVAAFPISSQNLCGDHLSFTYPKVFGVPIARSIIKSQHPGIPAARKASRHHRDLSGTSSTASTISGPPYDISSAIDPSALQSPLSKVPSDLEFGNGSGEITHIISPFVNQVVEQRPDGTFTGRYSRPMTSTGRPSHARKTPPGHVKRPRNAFILFRSYACSSNLIPPSVERDHRQISRIVSHMWRSLPSDERLKWERQAEEEKELHRKLHPDYRYKPIYRKENAAKKNQARLGSSSAARKKANSRKLNAKGSDGLAECGDLSQQQQDPEDLAGTRERRCSADLQRERDEEIRCEAVAKVLLETKLAGITLDEVQMEERVLEQVRLVKINDAHQIQSQQSGNNPPISEAATSTRTKKPKNKLLAPLQGRRKSFLNRSNSAPPPPSPLRMMQVREVVYNPKARGNRELSPDFPKPKVMEAEEDMLMMIPSDEPGPMQHGTYPVHLHSQYHSDHQFHPILHPGMIRNPAYLHYQLALSSPEDFEPLFPAAPDFSFPDETCFHSQQNHVAEEFFNSHMNPNEMHNFNNGDYSSNLESPLTGATSSEQAETTNRMVESKSPEQRGDSVMREEGTEIQGEYGGESRGEGVERADEGAENMRRTSLSIFTPAMRRRSSVMMRFSEGSNPGLEAALELARKNAAGSEHPSLQEDPDWPPSQQQPRRHSVLLSGLGEFPVMDLPPSIPDSAQVTILDYPWPEPPQTTREPEPSSGGGHEPICTPGYHPAPSSSEGFGELGAEGDVVEPTESVTFNSAIGQDGLTYLFLTKEQAETEGLIAQILDAGFGVTFESDQPPLPNL